MKNISHALGALPAPNVHPAFAGRIQATLEEHTADQRSRIMPWGLTFAGVAAMALLVASAYLPTTMRSTDNTPTQVALVENTPALELRDEATLLADFDRAFAEDNSTFTNVVLQAYAAEPVTSSLDEDFVVLALASNEVIDSVSNEWAVSHDLRSVVNSMNESETNLFKQLLADSVRSDSTGDAPQKG